MLIGYMRPYQDDLDCKVQKEVLSKIGCMKFFTEEHPSAKKRIQLEQMLESLEENDKIVVTRLYILADSTRHLVELLEFIEEKGVHLHSLYEDIDTSNSEEDNFFDIVKCLVEFQSDVISEKTKKGLYKAKQKGVIAGRPRKPDANVQRAVEMYQSKKYSLSEIREETGLSKSTLYRYLEN
ncbi:resolvase [Virgibacillus soli]|nr:resolvase [Virgibacillus soli]